MRLSSAFISKEVDIRAKLSKYYVRNYVTLKIENFTNLVKPPNVNRPNL